MRIRIPSRVRLGVPAALQIASIVCVVLSNSPCWSGISLDAALSGLPPRCAVITVHLPPLFRLLRLEPPRDYPGQLDLPRSRSPYRIPRRPPPRPPISIEQLDLGISGFLSLLVMEAPTGKVLE
jgi:hypothetical protein